MRASSACRTNTGTGAAGPLQFGCPYQDGCVPRWSTPRFLVQRAAGECFMLGEVVLSSIAERAMGRARSAHSDRCTLMPSPGVLDLSGLGSEHVKQGMWLVEEPQLGVQHRGRPREHWVQLGCGRPVETWFRVPEAVASEECRPTRSRLSA